MKKIKNLKDELLRQKKLNKLLVSKIKMLETLVQVQDDIICHLVDNTKQ